MEWLGRSQTAQGSIISISISIAADNPNANSQIHGHSPTAQGPLPCAALCLAIAGRLDEGRAHIAALNQRYPGYRLDDFFIAFHLAPADQVPFRDGAKHIGLE